ncbi:hypothetical protein I8H83_01565 [Candidatus Saccharibacteria bacterium]|nr:hypothetical protein [Candidatus Saccharibacteria bacterium]
MDKFTRPVEVLSDSITMYVATVCALSMITLTALVLSATGQLGFDIADLASTLAVLLLVSYSASRLFAWTFSTQHNRESWLITALILFLTLAPGDSTLEYVKLALVASIAVASKYLIAWRTRHIFNPAAIALAIGSLSGLTSAFWWVGTPLLLPVVVVAGVLIVSKTRRYLLASTFTATALITSAIVALISDYPLVDAIRLDLLSGPLVFFAAIMLTEPFTAPATRGRQLIYATFVGILYSSQLPLVSMPSIALLIGNLLTFYFVVRTGDLRFKVTGVKKIAPRTYELQATPYSRLNYLAGQYTELSIPHPKQDSRGSRRIFSFASSPDEATIRLTTRVPTGKSSSFKQVFTRIPVGATLRGSYIGGDFTLPKDASAPLVFIASGIGITPFRSMLAHMLATKDTRQITLFYFVRATDDILYAKLLAQAERELSVTVVFVVAQPSKTWQGEHGLPTKELFERYVTDISQHTVYISGSPTLVDSARAQLTGNYTPQRVVTDYFTGY